MDAITETIQKLYYTILPGDSIMANAVNIFPDPRYFPGVDGIVYVGADLEVKTLVQAYGLGIFPWPIES